MSQLLICIQAENSEGVSGGTLCLDPWVGRDLLGKHPTVTVIAHGFLRGITVVIDHAAST